MLRSLFAPALAAIALFSNAQQISYDWATEVVPSNNRVKTATDGGVFALGTGNNSAVIQRLNAAGAVLWTKTLQAPTLYGIDMDVDASDNIYIYVGFTTGQLDLDPGPFTTLVDPGKVYAKYTSNGQFLWGFSIPNTTDLSEDYSAISVDDAGNLYICGDLSQGTYDLDPGPGVTNIVCGDFTTGAYVARYRPDGSLVFADVRTWYGGFSNCRDIAVMRDGSFFYVVQSLDNGGSVWTENDVDPGPGVFNVYNETTSLLRYDSLYNFQGHAYANYGDLRLCADEQGAAYMMAGASSGGGFVATKFNGAGPTLDQVYETPLFTNGNLRLGDISPDEQGGCLGMYSLNNDFNSTIRFYKMDVSGLLDFDLYINSGNDWTYPGGKGFDIDGGGFYMGTYNENYPVDFDPGPGVISLPSDLNNDGVVARYDWCEGAPYEVLDMTYEAPLCLGDTITFNADAFGDASIYTWSLNAWSIISGQGTGTIEVLVEGTGDEVVSVIAGNACGSSAPYQETITSHEAVAELGEDMTWCYGFQGMLHVSCPGCSYSWEPGGETSSTINVDITGTTEYILTVSNNGCVDVDSLTITIDPCLGVTEARPEPIIIAPVPVMAGDALRVNGLASEELLTITGADGRQYSLSPIASHGSVLIATGGLSPGTYVLHARNGRAWRFVVTR